MIRSDLPPLRLAAQSQQSSCFVEEVAVNQAFSLKLVRYYWDIILYNINGKLMGYYWEIHGIFMGYHPFHLISNTMNHSFVEDKTTPVAS
jgi:hypothetical protein